MNSGNHGNRQDPEAQDALPELRGKEIELLRDTAIAVTSELNLDKVFQLITERARFLIQAETVLVPILDEACNQYTYRAGSGLNADEIVGESLPIDFGVCGWVWKHKKAWWRGILNELSESERNQWEKEAGTLILVPLNGKQHFLGGIAGINKVGGGDFTRRDLVLLEVFAAQAAIAIENAMAFEELEDARKLAEGLQDELQKLNRELKHTNQQLEHMALYDQLTELPNSSLLKDRLEQALLTAQRYDHPFSLLLLDLDHFKEVNDAYGHEAGDELLKQVAARINNVLRDTETAARLGGDEFAVILPQAAEEEARKVAQKIIKSLEPVFKLDKRDISISASAGIATYPMHGEDASLLLRHADIAMYSAKRLRLGVSLYNEQDDQRIDGTLALIGDIRRALSKQEFELHYQPQIDLVSGRIIGVEALSRWHHPKQGFVRPDTFIHMLEDTGLIHAFTNWVMETAFKQCAQWRARGYDLTMSINVSVLNLLEHQFIDKTYELMSRYKVEDRIIFEITENVFLSDYQHVDGIMRQLRDMGIHMSIDDFGTGHSSLSRLRRLPVSEVKIDKSFVFDMDLDSDNAIIVQSIIELGKNLGLKVVAEGVETEAVQDRLTALGCEVVQGFHIAKPMPLDAVEKFIKANT